jgi:WD40 repeat protein
MTQRRVPGLVAESHGPWGCCRTTAAVTLLWLLATLPAGRAQDPPALREVGKLVAPEVQAANSGLKQKASIAHLTFSPDGKELFGGSPLAGVVWDLKEQKVAAAQGISVSHPAYTKDGKRRLAYADLVDPKTQIGLGRTGFVTWDSRGKEDLGKVLTQGDPPLPRGVPLGSPDVIGGGPPEALVFSPDGKTAVSPPIYPLAPKGKPAASNYQLRVYDVARGVELRSFALKHTDDIRCLAHSPDGKLVASGSDDETARVWDVASGKEVAVFKGHTSPVRAIAFSPDGKTVASAGHHYPNGQKKGKIGEYSVYVWEARTGKEVARFGGHTSPVSALGFTPDGKRVLSLGDFPKGGAAVLWEAGTGTEVGRFPLTANVMAISPDGVLATTDREPGVVRLWRLP